MLLDIFKKNTFWSFLLTNYSKYTHQNIPLIKRDSKTVNSTKKYFFIINLFHYNNSNFISTKTDYRNYVHAALWKLTEYNLNSVTAFNDSKP